MADPRGIRNNNPGNIEAGSFAAGLPGYQGSDGRFAIFATPEDGIAAISDLLDHYGRRGINTVSGVVNRWAPPNENDDNSYIADVASHAGVDPNAPLSLTDPQVKRGIITGIIAHENGRVPYTPQQIAGVVGGTAPTPTAAAPAPLATVQNASNPFAASLKPGAMVDPFAASTPSAAAPSAPAAPSFLKAPTATVDPFAGIDVAGSAKTPPAAPPVANSDRLLGSAAAPLSAFAGGAVNGVPIIGPALESGLDRVAAVARSVRRDVPYSQALKEVQGMAPADAAAHPLLHTAGEVTGAVLGTAPLVATAPAAFGINGAASLGRNMLMGGATGSALGATDAAMRSGGDPGATLEGGAIGFGGGALGPVAGKIIGAGANKLISTARDFTPASAATQRMLGAIADSGSTPGEVANALMQNPRLAPVDVNPNLLHMGMGLAADGGAPRATIANFVASRSAGAPQAVEGAYDTALGQTPDVKAYLDNLKATTRANGQKAFGAALTDAKPVDVGPVIQSIDEKLHPGVNSLVSPESSSAIPQGPVEQALARVRGMLTDGQSNLTDADRLHALQSRLRIEADTLSKSASGQERLVGQALGSVRGKLVDAIDAATGGKFRPAQAQYADDMSINDAFNKGLGLFRNRGGESGLEDRPEYWQAWMKDASAPEKAALVKGVRVAVDQRIGAVRNAALAGETIPQAGLNADKLAIVLGKQEADNLVGVLRDEQRIATTHARLMGGSDTAARNAARGAIAVRDVAPIQKGDIGALGLPAFAEMTGHPYYAAGALASGLARKGLQYAGRAADARRNALLAEWLTSTGEGGNGVLNRLATVQATPPRFPAIANAGGNLLTNAAGQRVRRNLLMPEPVQ